VRITISIEDSLKAFKGFGVQSGIDLTSLSAFLDAME